MFYKLMICLCAILQVAAQKKENPVANEVVAIKAKCKGIDPSRYGGKNLHLLISITNQQPVAIGFPLAYEQQCGPSIRLVDSRTKAEAYLKTNLPDPALREQFTKIAPGKSVVLRWVIMNSEIDQFATPLVDISAEITVYADVELNGKQVETESTDTLHITGGRLP